MIRPVDAQGRPAIVGDARGRVDRFYLDEAALVASRSRPRSSAHVALEIAAVLLLLGVAVLAAVVMLVRG